MDERMRSIHHEGAFISIRRSTSPQRGARLPKLGFNNKKTIKFISGGFRQGSTKRSIAYNNPSWLFLYLIAVGVTLRVWTFECFVAILWKNVVSIKFGIKPLSLLFFSRF